jgi:hypothetical protein
VKQTEWSVMAGSLCNHIQMYLSTLTPVSYYIHILSYSYSLVFIFNERVCHRIVFICIWIYSKVNFPYHIFGQH